jgi:hypothetical protein
MTSQTRVFREYIPHAWTSRMGLGLIMLNSALHGVQPPPKLTNTSSPDAPSWWWPEQLKFTTVECRSRRDLDRSLWAWLCRHWRSTVGKFAGWWRSKRLPAIIRRSGYSWILWESFCQNEALKVSTSRDRTGHVYIHVHIYYRHCDWSHNPAVRMRTRGNKMAVLHWVLWRRCHGLCVSFSWPMLYLQIGKKKEWHVYILVYVNM